jgi:hypothetical protein
MQRMREFGAPLLDVDALGEKYSKLREQDFVRIGKVYGQQYVVVNAGVTLKLPRAYSNDRYAVYRIDPGVER